MELHSLFPRRPRSRPLRAWPLLIGLVFAVKAPAQELEPRSYAPNPVGANFALVAYTYQTGDVLFDPSIPITDASAKLNAAIFGYGRTFGLFGKSANFGIAIPYVWGSAQGNVGEELRVADRSGLGDLRAKLTVNILGAPALTPQEFAQRRPGTILGVSLTVQAPSGQYDPARLVNIGTNRWAFNPQVGASHPWGRWYLELYAGVWFFTANDDFYGGQVREQAPLASFQAHVSYTFRPRMWLALDATFYTGGRTTTNGVEADDRQKNTRLGLTFALPVTRNQSVKLSYAKGATVRVGGNFSTIGIAYQIVWFKWPWETGPKS